MVTQKRYETRRAAEFRETLNERAMVTRMAAQSATMFKNL